MVKKDKLNRKAKKSPENFSFTEICSLAEHVVLNFGINPAVTKYINTLKLRKCLIFNLIKEIKEREEKLKKELQEKGHGRTPKPDLPVKDEYIDLSPKEQLCPKCGKPYISNGTEDSEIVEVEVKA